MYWVQFIASLMMYVIHIANIYIRKIIRFRKLYLLEHTLKLINTVKNI